MSIQAYQRAATQVESAREVEYRAFGKVTADLMRAKEGGRVHLGALAEALDANRRLWHVMGSDCALPANRLPANLRAQIISLAMWVAKYSSEVLRGQAEIDPLIDVNRTMMEGLAGR